MADDVPRRARVLVIDDEPAILRAMLRVLHDHEVVCVGRAEAALAEIASGAQFDVILTDVMMPGMTGVDLFDTLRTSHAALAARVIFMTGGVPDPAIAHALDAIPNPKLSKPTPPAQLRDAIQLMFLA